MSDRLICDTNVWFNAAHGQVSLASLTKNNGVLCISPLTILEFFATLNVGNFAYRKKAAELAISSHALLLSNTDIHAAELVGVKPVADQTLWKDALLALAQAADFNQLQKGITDSAAGLVRVVSPAAAESWLLQLRARWVADHDLSLIRTGAVTTTANTPPRPQAMDPATRNKLDTMFKSSEWYLAVIGALRAKAALSWFLDTGADLDLNSFPVPSTALASTHVYAAVYGRYHYAMRVEGLRPQPNDSEDVEYFLYVNAPNDRIVTSENRWHARAKDAGVSQYVLKP